MNPIYDLNTIKQYTMGAVCIVTTSSFEGIGHVAGFVLTDDHKVLISVKLAIVGGDMLHYFEPWCVQVVNKDTNYANS